MAVLYFRYQHECRIIRRKCTVKHQIAIIRNASTRKDIAKKFSLGDRVTVDDAAYVLASISDVNLKISLPVIEQRHVAIGQHVEFWCQQLPRKNFVGDIDSLRFSSDPSSSNFTVNVTLKNPQAALRPDMSGQAKISVK